MTTFSHREGEGTVEDGAGGDLEFFCQYNADEHWFPSYDVVSLELDISQLDHALHLLNAAETVAPAFGSVVTIETNTPQVGWLQIEADVEDEGRWDTGYSVFEVRVTLGEGEVRWRAVYEHDESSLGTNFINRAGLLAMREGRLPS